jgi:hypothetical protein
MALSLFDVEKDDQGSRLRRVFALTCLLISGAVAVAFTGLNIGELRARPQT